jgi:hypothetical protein
MAKVKQKRMSQDELEKIVTGGEPNFSDKVISKLEMSQVTNWYSNNRDAKDAQKYIVDYFKKNKLKLNAKLTEIQANTVGWIFRLVNRGAILSKTDKEWFDARVKFLTDTESNKAIVTETKSNVISIQDRVKQKALDIAGEIDYSIDELIVSHFKTVRSPQAIMQGRVKAAHAKYIVEIYKKEREEIQEVLDTDDEQLIEAYSKFSKLQMRKLLSYYDQIINDAIKLAGDSKQSRKPRKRKTKTPDQLVAKINILSEDKEFKLKSEDAKKIIGSTQVWVFNVKTRKLGVYHADDASGLTVKGSTIQNYSEQKSVMKTLRKPELILPEIVKGGKVYLRNVMDEIKAKEKNLTGRLNGDTILVKIV